MMRLSKNAFQKLAVLSLIVVVSFACKKKAADDPAPTCVAGTGGSTTLVVVLRHHSLLIPSDSVHPDTVWIKYNAVNAGSGYDQRVIGIPGDTSIVVGNLKCGNYFLTASGYDNSISLPVNGGLGIRIEENADTVVSTVPVVE